MIVCSCNCITDRDILETVDRLMLEEPLRLITPAVVYKALGKRPRCGGCMPNTNEIVQARVDYLRGDATEYVDPTPDVIHAADETRVETDHATAAHFAR
ncbi:MAG: (2Fe-2S)-binding protein [Hyphomicrobiaceae bacterium]